MELKDAVISTLAEIDSAEEEASKDSSYEKAFSVAETKRIEDSEKSQLKPLNAPATIETSLKKSVPLQNPKDETPFSEELFLKSLQERVLVLFEGFQSPNNSNIDAKVDLTLNFLEYLLASLDKRLDNIK